MRFILKLQFVFLLIFLINGNTSAQYKLFEQFTGTTFPPDGWTSVAVLAGDGTWARTTTYFRSTPSSAFSRYSALSGNNYLITKRFVPASGDSLVFWLRQVFSTNYADTLKIRVSTTDSTVASFTTILKTLKDGEYPTVPNYGRFAVDLSAYSGSTIWIAFQHVDTDGESLSIDDVSVGSPAANQITIADASALDSACTEETYAPRASFTNTGTANQYNFNVTFQITGPTLSNSLVYSSTKTIDTLLAGAAKTITFDSTFAPIDSGNYDANITSAVGEFVPFLGKIKIRFKNKGLGVLGAGCIWYANSQSDIATKPVFSWKNPGNVAKPPRVDLIYNAALVVNIPATPLTGSLDDGYFSLLNKLGSKRIRLGGVCYKDFYPATNGNIGLTGGNTTFTVGYATGVFPGILPLFMDLDFNTASVTHPNRLSYFVTNNELVVSWENVRRFRSPVDTTDYVTFQACIELVDSGCVGANSNIRFSYLVTGTSATFKTPAVGPPPALGAVGLASIGAGNTNTVSNQLVGLRPAAGASLYYRERNKPAAGTVNTITGPLFGGANDNTNNLAVEFADCFLPLNKCNSKVLSTKLYIEGYKQSGTSLLDTVNVEVRDAVSPYALLETNGGQMDSQGRLYLPFSYLQTGKAYYLRLIQRNTINTWSNIVIGPQATEADTLSYDFTTSLSQAYGSNQTLVGANVCIYSGDVNKDGIVDLTDGLLVDNDSYNFASGYIPTDANGDDIVDLSDAAIVDNNTFNFVAEVAPPGPIAGDSYYSLPMITVGAPNEDAYRLEKMNQLRNEMLRLTSPVKIK